MIAKVENAAPKAVQEYDDNHQLVRVDPGQRGEVMAYATQSMFFNAATNSVESYINGLVQKRLAGPKGKTSSYGVNLTADFAGDAISAGGIMLAEMYAPVQLHTLTRGLRHMIHPLYTSVAHSAFGAVSDPAKQREDDIRNERAIVRGALVAVGSITGNLLTQKVLLQNPSPTKNVFLGKVAGASLTAALGVVMRMVAPHRSEKLDRWMTKNLFMPLFGDAQERIPSQNDAGDAASTGKAGPVHDQKFAHAVVRRRAGTHALERGSEFHVGI